MDTTLLKVSSSTIIASSEAGEFKTLCSTSCGGVENAYGACCSIYNKNSIIGPIPDAADLIERLQTKFPGIVYEEVFMDFEEGSSLFPDKEAAQDPWHYPALRVTEDHSCMFYIDKGCSIQQEKSVLCKSYVCEYLRKLKGWETIYPSGTVVSEEEFKGTKDIISIV